MAATARPLCLTEALPVDTAFPTWATSSSSLPTAAATPLSSPTAVPLPRVSRRCLLCCWFSLLTPHRWLRTPGSLRIRRPVSAAPGRPRLLVLAKISEIRCPLVVGIRNSGTCGQDMLPTLNCSESDRRSCARPLVRSSFGDILRCNTIPGSSVALDLWKIKPQPAVKRVGNGLVFSNGMVFCFCP